MNGASRPRIMPPVVLVVTLAVLLPACSQPRAPTLPVSPTGETTSPTEEKTPTTSEPTSAETTTDESQPAADIEEGPRPIVVTSRTEAPASKEGGTEMRVRGLPVGLAAGPLAVSLPFPAPVAQASSRCFGKTPTIVGTGGRDRLAGTSGPDIIAGLGGDDKIAGRGGDDRICGGAGDDTIWGERGSNQLAGGGGSDELSGDRARDWLVGGTGDDAMFAYGGSDIGSGGGGEDVLIGGPGNDRMVGGGAFDFFSGDPGNDRLDGGEDLADRVWFGWTTNPVTVDLTAGSATGEGTDSIRGIEDVVGSKANDTLTGDGAANWFWPLAGDDLVNGADNEDAVLFFVSPAPVTADLSIGTATGEGTDSITAVEDLIGSGFNDVLTGNPGPNWLLGEGGDDALVGLEDDDVLWGQEGSDTATGGPHILGDRCVETEISNECEAFELPRARTARTALRPSPPTSGLEIFSGDPFLPLAVEGR